MNEDVGSCQQCKQPCQADDVIVPLPVVSAGEERQMLLCNACKPRPSGMTAHQAALRRTDVRPMPPLRFPATLKAVWIGDDSIGCRCRDMVCV